MHGRFKSEAYCWRVNNAKGTIAATGMTASKKAPIPNREMMNIDKPVATV
ncbi:hypothetical protein [uncultured Brevibacillus sp.]|nr:hypothetical protein [uncultured Brevibacillus sp.]